jgi:hypothetical protein
VFNSRYGVVDDHSRACPAHYGADLLAHIGLVAVDMAVLTRRFLLSKFAAIEAFVCIGNQFLVLVIYSWEM